MKAEQIDDSKLTWHLVSTALPAREGYYRVALRVVHNGGWKRGESYWNRFRWSAGEDVIAWGAEAVQGKLPLK